MGDAGSAIESSPGSGEASVKRNLADSIAHSAKRLNKFMITTVNKLQS